MHVICVFMCTGLWSVCVRVCSVCQCIHVRAVECVCRAGVFMCTGLWSVCACNRCIHVHRAVECVCM